MPWAWTRAPEFPARALALIGAGDRPTVAAVVAAQVLVGGRGSGKSGPSGGESSQARLATAFASSPPWLQRRSRFPSAHTLRRSLAVGWPSRVLHLPQEVLDRAHPLIRVADDTRFVPDAQELFEMFGPANRGEYPPCFLWMRSNVSPSVKKENRAPNVCRILDWIVGEAVEASLATSPENQKFGARK